MLNRMPYDLYGNLLYWMLYRMYIVYWNMFHRVFFRMHLLYWWLFLGVLNIL